MFNTRAIMKAAWAQYRRIAFRNRPFNSETFAAVLRFVWKQAKAAAVYARVQEAADKAAALVVASVAKPMSEMERRIDDLKYLPARYRIDMMEREIRAEYAHA